ncbi:MAG: hypothetical protein LBH20_08965, partial [Treponema sp.]|nr:hypothetical protein [Treponema sp.]
MKGKIGCPTRIIPPVLLMRELAKGETKELSEKAKFRLKVFDWYYHNSAWLFTGRAAGGHAVMAATICVNLRRIKNTKLRYPLAFRVSAKIRQAGEVFFQTF